MTIEEDAVTTPEATTQNPSRPRSERRSATTWLWVVFWLIFLVQPVTSDITAGGGRTAGACILIAGGLLYGLQTTRIMRRMWSGLPLTTRDQNITGLVAMVMTGGMLAAAPLLGQSAFALMPYCVVVLALGSAFNVGATLVLSLCAATYALSPSLTGEPLETGLLFASLASGAAAGLGAFSAARGREAEEAREDAALLRVQEERNRMARDLHDILGHSLTVITMKAELAGKLVDLDPDKAKEQIAELEQLSRSALADVRTTVSGYREMSLSGEIARARTALTDAGVRADMPMSVDAVSPDLRELFAWAVREATTNVIRHSGANRCTVTIEPTRLVVADDGRGSEATPGTATRSGNGLAGLRERAEAVGASVAVDTSDGFRITVGAPPRNNGDAT